ncbi:Enoyl-CoA hydratase [Georgfuchsia toluolica]|uniref:Enoyl-CoA hydratase n=1 Tax=Georgfuchsia toluolica TaxID=424218 RepID=A0A916NIZ3_9PROT|nr:enoyl-CoA hydratase-related protein [Georgfuchsia toluolica]CAG4885118.1 Enoyl-CoA hydratase [Georgfuchsia toluolica]
MEPQLPLIYEKNGAIARIQFNRPKALNALDIATAKAFLTACQAIAADAEVRAVVIKGEGRAFMAGGDLVQMRSDPTAVANELIEHMHAAIKLLASVRAPVVASLHGAVAGAGFSLALACDLAIAAEGTRFTLAYANVGTACDCSGSWNLPRQIGLRQALGIALLGETLDAKQALQLGIVNRVVPAADLQMETEKLVQRLANGPTEAFGRIKKLIRNSLDCDLATQLDAERDSFLACTHTQDFKGALAAFVEKRPPKFEGR